MASTEDRLYAWAEPVLGMGSFATDSWLPARLKAFADLVQAEARLYNRIWRALVDWASRARVALFGFSARGVPDVQALPATFRDFTQVVDDVVDVEIREIMLEAGDFEDFAELDSNAHVESYLSSTRDRLVKVPERVYSSIRAEVLKATAQGWSIDDLETGIDKILGENDVAVWRNRARVIARTEALSAYNAARFAGYLGTAKALGGAWDKIWLATHDSHTRPTHAVGTGADGQRQALTSPFIVGGAAMMFPGDPEGPPEEVIQCRCSLLLARRGEPVDTSNRHFRRPA